MTSSHKDGCMNLFMMCVLPLCPPSSLASNPLAAPTSRSSQSGLPWFCSILGPPSSPLLHVLLISVFLPFLFSFPEVWVSGSNFANNTLPTIVNGAKMQPSATAAQNSLTYVVPLTFCCSSVGPEAMGRLLALLHSHATMSDLSKQHCFKFLHPTLFPVSSSSTALVDPFSDLYLSSVAQMHTTRLKLFQN